MVEQIRISPEEVRGYGNICEEHSLDDFIVSSSGLAKEKEDVHGALTSVYRLVYSLYGLMFYFDKGNKQLYLQTAEADTLSFGFDEESKQLYLVDVDDTGFNLGFDEDTNELYITDDAPPIVHIYTLALDSDSYTTSGSLSVSATLLDDGVAVEGATISFTGGDATVTATTNSSGVATATVNFTSSGTLTASYSNVSDTATVTVQSSVSSVLLTGTSNILSNYHNETCTLSATVLDTNSQPVNGETVTFYKGSNSIGTATTNASGVATKTYSSTGAGDVSFTAECSDITSSAYSVEDCLWFDAAVTGNTHSSDYSNFGSAPTLTATTDGMKISTTSGDVWATIPILLTTDDDFELTYTYNGGEGYANTVEISSASNQRHTVFYTWLNNNTWSYTKNNTGAHTFYTGAINVGDKIKIRRVNGVYTYYQNDIIRLNNLSNNSGGYVAFVTYKDGRYTIYKDIKVKAI